MFAGERLIGAQSFTDEEMRDSILRGRDDLRNPCDRVGPLSFEYYQRAARDAWSALRGAVAAGRGRQRPPSDFAPTPDQR